MIPLALFGLPTGQVLILATVFCLFLFAMGIPIYLVFGVWVLIYHATVPVFPIVNMSLAHYEVLQSFPFTAIPLFILVGDLINEAKISEEIVAFARELIGWFPGATGNTAIGTSGIFSAITGSNAATTASVGNALYPSLINDGYEESYAAGTIAAGGVLGAIIPPSILLIIYGVSFGVSIVDLFIAGALPGLAMLIVLVGINSVICRRNGYGTVTEFGLDPGAIARKGWEAKLGIGTIVVLLGGIFLGLFTPTESATVAVFYILVTAVATRKITSVDQVVRASFTSLILIGIIIPIVVTSILIQQSLSFLGIQTIISEAIIALNNEWLMIGAMILIMLISGSLLDSVPNLLITAPMLSAAATELGWGPITWGIIFMMSDSIGFITPPYGLNLYIISGIADINYIRVAYAALPHLIGLSSVWIGVMIISL